MDRNAASAVLFSARLASLSARRAWIEISITMRRRTAHAVALRKESVDRNIPAQRLQQHVQRSLSARRAWIEIIHKFQKSKKDRSLSARRAWIEIIVWQKKGQANNVALRKESVDRNGVGNWPRVMIPSSLSARRAWIEIESNREKKKHPESLSARRAWIEIGCPLR